RNRRAVRCPGIPSAMTSSSSTIRTFAILVESMKWPFFRNREERTAELEALRVEAARAGALVEQSPELLVVLDAGDRVVAASRRARDLDGIAKGRRVPAAVLGGDGFRKPVRVTYDVNGRRETILYLDPPGEPAGYQELRAGLPAADFHEIRP